jgi:NAD(P)H-dependent flavin oxidoreductase YrpB (nitropropane dioxygenase family)
MRTALCERLGIDFPVIQAPIGGASGPELAAAVSGAGGLGSISLTGHRADAVRERIEVVRRRTDRPFVANFILSYAIEEAFAAALAARAPIVSLFWGDPRPWAPRVHDAGALLMVTVGSVEEAGSAVAAGADVIVAQGWEAGGHVRGSVATLALVPAVVDAVAPVPVIAAGGIADGRGLAAALALGAGAAWIGTRFVAAAEAGVHPLYREAVLAAAAADTHYSRLYDGTWPDAPGRVLRNTTVAAWEAAGCPAPGARPGEGEVVARDAEGPIHRYDAVTPRPDIVGDIEAMSLWAGQGVGLVRRQQPAAAIVAELVAEARAAMLLGGRLAGGSSAPV